GGWILHRLAVVHDGEIAVVEGHEGVVAPAGDLDRVERHAVRCEQAGLASLPGEVVVEAEHAVGGAALTFEPQPVEQRRAVGHRDELQVAAAFGLERLLDDRARAPFGREALVSVDGKRLLRLRGRGKHEKGCGKHGYGYVHRTPPSVRCGDWRLGMQASNPSAGTSRIRFGGLAVRLSAGTVSRPAPR